MSLLYQSDIYRSVFTTVSASRNPVVFLDLNINDYMNDYLHAFINKWPCS